MRKDLPSLFAFLPLAAIPMAAAVLASFKPIVVSADYEQSVGEQLRYLVLEDWLGPPFIVIALLACLHSCRVLMVALEDRQVPGALALLPLLIPAVLAFALVDHQLMALMKPSTHCGPMRFENIMVGTAGDFLLLRVVALVSAGCAAICIALALVPTLQGNERLARAAFILSIAVMGASLLVSSDASMEARAALVLTAFRERTTQLGDLLPSIERWQRVNQASTTLLLWALLLALGACLRLASRGEGKAAVGALAMIALVGIGHRSASVLEQRHVQRTLAANYYFEQHTPYWVLRPTSKASDLRDDASGLFLEPNDRATDFARALSRVHQKRSELTLSRRVSPFTVPLVFGPASLLRGVELERVAMSVRFEDEPSCALKAKRVGDALEVSGGIAKPRRWKPAARENFEDEASLSPKGECVELETPNERPPLEVLADAETIVANGHWPVIRVARSEQK